MPRPLLSKSSSTKRRVLVLVSCWTVVQLYLHLTTFSGLSTVTPSGIDLSANVNELNDYTPLLQRQQQPRQDDDFPRILHFLWPNKDFDYGRDKDPHGVEQERTLALVKRIQDNNPEWTTRIWTDDDCHAFMKRYYPQYYSNWIALSPQLKMWDAVRPCILSIHGGIYLDHDIDCSVGLSFDDWIIRVNHTTTTRLLLREPTHDKNKLGNHFMGSIPAHPLWQLYLDNIWKDTPKNYSVVRHTGPLQLYPTFQEYLKRYNQTERLVINESSIRLLSLQEFENPGECIRVTGNPSYCNAKPHCVHMHTASPAELNGQDDNALLQISQYEARLQAANMNYTQVPWACQRFNDFVSKRSNTDGTRPVVFIHVPKTGGTSIESTMGFQRSCHASARDYMKCNPGEFQRAFKFAVLRNPVERIVSLYNYAKSGGNGGIKDKTKFHWVKELDLRGFVEALPSRQEVNYAPQAYFVLDDNKELLVDQFLCMERLVVDWKKLQSHEPSMDMFGDLPTKRLRSSSTNVSMSSDQVIRDIERRLRDLYPHDFQLWDKHCVNSVT